MPTSVISLRNEVLERLSDLLQVPRNQFAVEMFGVTTTEVVNLLHLSRDISRLARRMPTPVPHLV